MKNIFNDWKFRKTSVIEVSNLRNTDERCATILLKIYLTLHYNQDVKIVSKSLLPNEIFPQDNYQIKKNETLLKINISNMEITLSKNNDRRLYSINSLTISDYIYTLLFINDYIVDSELIGFYTMLAMKSSLSNDEDLQKIIKLRNILTKPQFYTLEYNVDQVIDNISKYML